VSDSLRRSSPATARNREPILALLRRVLPERGLVLEISSGAGEHAAFLSKQFPDLEWQPSDVDASALASIEAWRSDGSEKLQPPVPLDVTSPSWPISHAQVVININMIHIAPWKACEGLMHGTGRVLSQGGLMLLYGPFRVDGQHTAATNAAFDTSLQARDPTWGVREMSDVIEEARSNDLHFEEQVAMPANNFSLIFRRA
jgi:hypothetical protein